MFFERRHLRTVAAVLALTMASSLTGCGTTGSSTTPATAVKNVILVIGDGMQLEHERAANNYLFGNYTEGLAFWKFPYQGQASTWDVTTYNKFATAAGKSVWSASTSTADDSTTFDALLGYDPAKGGKQPWPLDSTGDKTYLLTGATDSASAGTALATGYKTDDGNVAWKTGDPEDGRLLTIAEMYRYQKKAAIGVVSTVPFTHATPATFVSHNKSRNNYKDIGYEIINSVKPEVVIGGGHPNYTTSYMDTRDYNILKASTEYVLAERQTGVDGNTTIAAKATEAVANSKKLFGLFGNSGGQFDYPVPSNTPGTPSVVRGNIENPSLAEASKAALKVLAQNKNGFFLMIEQGDIDWANHANDFKSMVGGVYDLNETVKAIESYVDQPGDDIDWNNTLVIVTSDHGNSYMRLNSAKPLQKGALPQQDANSTSNGSYTPSYVYPNGEVTYGTGGHTNELVRVYAKGGKTSLLNSFEGIWYAGTKIIDNTQLYKVMMSALGLTDQNKQSSLLDKVIAMLPDSLLSILNPKLTTTQLNNAITNGARTVTKPGIGSALVPDPKAAGYYYMMTDRGINGDYSYTDPVSGVTTEGKYFPLPAFTPTIVRVKLDGSTIIIDKVIPIVDKDGNYVTGIPNDANDGLAYDSPTAAVGSPLAYNENGLDTEDMQVLPNGDFLVVDEHSPSIVVVEGTTGKVKVRYTPAGKKLTGANYTVKDILPAVMLQRRANRGFENLALSSDGKTAYAVMQSPMGQKSDPNYSTAYKNSRVVRIARLDVTDPVNATVTGHYVVMQSAVADYAKNSAGLTVSNKQTDMKYSAASWLAKDKILLLERANGKAKVFVVDLNFATNMLGKSYENTLGPEDIATAGLGLGGLGIVPASVYEAFSTDELPALTLDAADATGTSPSYEVKFEGMALVGDQLLLANDNDFGIADVTLPTKIWKVSLKRALGSF